MHHTGTSPYSGVRLIFTKYEVKDLLAEKGKTEMFSMTADGDEMGAVLEVAIIHTGDPVPY